uniref:Uncharacterized protein n=1 Tax=Tanacetum cinerariifolium TaxID=118510 RepID=A0A6L2P6D0_TANCI|nr:hypothetical protein [Tanacetum cinerariifolium]
MTPTQALTAIQPMAEHSQKWHDRTSSRNISSISTTDGLVAIDLTLTKNVLSTRKSNRWKRSSMDNFVNTILLLSRRNRVFFATFGFSDDEKSESTELKTSKVIPALKSNLPEQTVNHYVKPYTPPIPYPNRLKQHAKEALVHKTMESLKKIKINRPLRKEIRQTDNYPKYTKDLVANNQLTEEDDEVKMNPRCLTLLQNQLPLKENDLGSFIHPFSIKSHLSSTDPDVFTYDIMVQESYEEIVYRCSLIAQEANGGLRKIFGNEYDDNEDFEDPDGCMKSKENQVIGTIINKLQDEWFKGTHEDDDDLVGIIDYLEPTLYDGFINSDDEEYKERKYRLLGMLYIKPPLILIEKVKVTRYRVGPGEVYTKIKVSKVEELSRTRGNITTIRAGIKEEIFRNDDEKESYDET